MRKIISSIMLVAVAAMTFVSCQKDKIDALKDTFSTTLTINTEIETTKTYIEDNTILWGKGESTTLYVKDGSTEPQFITSTSTDTFNGKASAAFSFNIQNLTQAASYNLGGIYPASASKGISNENADAYKVALPATQNASVDGYDPAAFIMVLKPETVQTIPSQYTAWFRRAVALNKITLTNVEEAISSVEITVPQNKYLAGRRYIDLTTGKSGEIYEGGGRTNTIKVNAAYQPGSIDVWFTSWGVNLTEGEKLTVKMTSESKVYTHTIVARAEGIKFLEGSLNTLTINMESAEAEVNDDLSGEYLIAAVPKAWNLMSGTNGGKYFDRVESKVTTTATTVKYSDFYALSNVEACVWTVAKMSGGYSIKNNKTGKYISYSGSSNEAYASNTAAALSLSENAGIMTVESVAVPGRKLKYNATSPRFAFYSTDQTPLYFIPWVADTTPRISVAQTAYSVQATAGSVDLTYSTNSMVTGNVTATVKSGATMDIKSAVVGTGKVTVTYGENTAQESKTATIVLAYEGAESKEIVITQAAKPVGGQTTTVTKSSFSATTGTIDSVISYTTAKGGGTSAPAVNSNQIRLYQNSSGQKGGSITIKAANGYTLTSVTIGSSMKTSVVYTIGSTDSAKKDIAANGKLTVNDINSNSITFHCMGTTSSTRLYVNYLSATYQAN